MTSTTPPVMTLTDDLLAELEELAAEATPGPWFKVDSMLYRRPKAELYEHGGGVAGDKPLATFGKGWYDAGSTGYPVERNVAYAAAANPATVLALIARVRELEKELERKSAPPARGVQDW